MKMKGLYVGVIALSVSCTVVCAEESVLAPGSKLVAGDLTKNEFYILAQNENPPAAIIVPKSKPIATHPIKPIAAVKTQSVKNEKHKPVSNSTHHLASKRTMAKIRMALSKAHKHIAIKKTFIKIKAALHKKHLPLANTKKMATKHPAIKLQSSTAKKTHAMLKPVGHKMKKTINKVG